MSDKRFRIYCSLLSALLLSGAWYWHLGFLIFFAFTPLLLLEEQLRSAFPKAYKAKLFRYSYLSFFLWNVLVTWWIVYASFGGACMAIFCNALLMAVVFWIYSWLRSYLKSDASVWLLIPVWIAFEHIHTLWDISWTWLTLGNVFAFHHRWVQWYELTGTSGGTLWILAVNILAFQIIHKTKTKKLFSRPIAILAASILAPILISYLIYFLRRPLPFTSKAEIVVVQPNFDPYHVKFNLGYQQQFQKVMGLIRGKVTDNTAYLVLPETFITGENGDLNEENLNTEIEIEWFRDSLIRRFPNLKIVTGASTYKFYYKKEDYTGTSRLDERSGYEYDVFNTGLFIGPDTCMVYHKSILVPGVEKMPFPALFKPLEKMAINMGGTIGSLGIQKHRTVFIDKDRNTGIAPVICYESVYADYVTEYVRNGAGLIFIITNDGWWDDTPGYKHHLNYARLRAIENRREIARSANTGISCFVDAYGNISQPTEWWKEDVITGTLHVNEELTFFTRYGDLLSYSSVGFCVFLLLFLCFKGIMRRITKQI